METGQTLRPIARMHNRLHFKTYFLIAIMIVTGPIGNLLIAKGMKDLGPINYWPPSVLFRVFVRVFSSLTIWIGIASLITFIIAYMLALSLADYSYVQPAAALSYVLIAVLGVLVLGEKVSPMHWAGIVVICLGVSFIRGTNPRTTETPN
jgi:drug/metabolite transporter (DMT)-like permease